MASENEKRATLADIVAEMRHDAELCHDLWLNDPNNNSQSDSFCEILNGYARRIEALAKRGRAPVGNAAAMREALVEAIGETCAGCKRDCDDCMNLKSGWMKKAKAALSAPTRNCDVGTAEEQDVRFVAWRYSEPLRAEFGLDALEWAQLPYETEEGGAK